MENTDSKRSEDNSCNRGINHIVDSVENGMKSEISGLSIHQANPNILCPSSMNKEDNNEGKNSNKNKESCKSKESLENLDLTTALSNLKNEMNQGFAGIKKEITGMKEDLKKGITEMKNGITEMKNGITEMKNEIIGLKKEISKGFEKIAISINIYHSLFIIIIAFIIFLLINKFMINFKNN